MPWPVPIIAILSASFLFFVWKRGKRVEDAGDQFANGDVISLPAGFSRLSGCPAAADPGGRATISSLHDERSNP